VLVVEEGHHRFLETVGERGGTATVLVEMQVKSTIAQRGGRPRRDTLVAYVSANASLCTSNHVSE
jgi:hypothetical protein